MKNNKKVLSRHQALVLIDLQDGFYDACWGKRNNPALEDNAAQLLMQWRQHHWPVFHVRHDSFSKDSTLRFGVSGFEFIDALKPVTGESVLTKRVNSAFIGTSLEIELRQIGISDIVLLGLTTDHCVSTFARMAENLGFRVTVVSDATATFPKRLGDEVFNSESVHKLALASLNNEFATVLSTDAIIQDCIQ